MARTHNNQLNHQLTVYKTTPIMKALIFLSFILVIFLLFRVNKLEDKIQQLQGKITEKQIRNQIEMKGQFGQEIKEIQFQILILEKEVEKSNALIYKELAQLANNQRVVYAALPNSENSETKTDKINANSEQQENDESILQSGRKKFNNFAESVSESETLKGFSSKLSQGSEKMKQMWNNIDFSGIGTKAKGLFGGKKQAKEKTKPKEETL